MGKWADYLISAVRYDNEHTNIIMIKQHVDKDDKVGSAEEVSRSTVVDNLDKNYTYKTIYKNSNGEWYKGEKVRIIKVNNSEFITTDPNETKKDNLGQLPEF